jgi:hypothetical protein
MMPIDVQPPVDTKLNYRALYAFAYAQYRSDFQTTYRILVAYRNGYMRGNAARLARENALASYLMKIDMPPHLAQEMQTA